MLSFVDGVDEPRQLFGLSSGRAPLKELGQIGFAGVESGDAHAKTIFCFLMRKRMGRQAVAIVRDKFALDTAKSAVVSAVLAYSP